MAQQRAASPEVPRPRPRSYQSPPPPRADGQPLPGPTTTLPVRQEEETHQSAPINTINAASGSTETYTSAIEGTNSDDVHPDLVAQITEQVINSLKLNGITSSGSPSLSKVQSNTSVETHLTQEPASVSPEAQLDSGWTELSPTASEVVHLDGYVEERKSTRRSPEHISSASPSSRSQERYRPQAPPREPTDDITTLEKIWQPLFTSGGAPTPRLGQFLRGLAIYIIEEFEPPHSLVITPSKMLEFYQRAKLPEEVYPWNSIFGGRMTNSSLSHLYRDLKCQHHFVQNQADEKPSIPALTPAGFETWMTVVIRAHPDLECDRFQIAVRDLPVSNADNSKERFPRDLSRRLFPRQTDEDALLDLEDAILADREIGLTPFGMAERERRDCSAAVPSVGMTAKPSSTSQATQRLSNFVEPPKLPPSPSQKPHMSSTTVSPPPLPQTIPSTRMSPTPLNKPRQVHHTPVSSEAVVDDSPLAVSIERERQPYYAAPGGGKVYNEESRSGLPDPSPAPRSYTSGTTARPMVGQQDDYEVAPRQRTGSLTMGTAPLQRYTSPPRGGPQTVYSWSDPNVPPNTGEPFAPHPQREHDVGNQDRRNSRTDPRRGSRDEPTSPRSTRAPSRDQQSRRDSRPPPNVKQSSSRNEYDDERYRNHQHSYLPPPPPPPPSSSRRA